MITAPIATIIAAVIAGAVAIFGSMALVYHRLGKLEQAVEANRELQQAENARLSDKMDTQHAETMREIRRLVDALISHSHDADGSIIFRIPPGSATDRHPQEGEDSEAPEDSDSPD